VKFRRPLPATAAVAAVAVLGLGACSNEPSPRSVVNGVIDSLDADDATKECMHDVVESYTDEQLEQMSADNPGFNSANPDLTDATPEFQDYLDALEACTADG
jgi:hypothetical protein